MAAASIIVTDPKVIEHLRTYDPMRRPSSKVCVVGVHPVRPHVSSGGVMVNCTCGNFWPDQCCNPPCKMHGCGVRKGCACPAPTEAQGEAPTTAEMTGG